MKPKTDKAEPSPRALPFDWKAALVTLLVSAVAFGLVAGQFSSSAQDPQNPNSLYNLNQRVPFLEHLTNSIERDQYCVPLSALGRRLDAGIAPNAKVFMTDMLGPTNQGSLGYYYFLRNYLFPRHVQISLDGNAIDTMQGFTGVPCDSPGILKSNGYDVVILFANGQIQNIIALTTNATRQSASPSQ